MSAGKELARLFKHVPGATRLGGAVKWRPGGLRKNILLNEDRDSPLKCVEACKDGSVRFTFERPDERTKAILAKLVELEGKTTRLLDVITTRAHATTRSFFDTVKPKQERKSTSRIWHSAGGGS